VEKKRYRIAGNFGAVLKFAKFFTEELHIGSTYVQFIAKFAKVSPLKCSQLYY
jgi:hypothetical protein